MPDQIRNSSFQKEFGGFEKLMPFRVRNILLAASLYDSFLLADDENLNEALFGYSENAADGLPKITRVSSADEALKQLRLEKYDLVISMLQPEDAGFACFFRDIKTISPGIPAVLLAFNVREARTFPEEVKKLADGIFLWNGDTRIFSAIINVIEDARNFDSDSRTGVQAVLLIEDNVKFYSSYLPVIYTELLEQTRLVMAGELNPAKKHLRLKARPRILFCSDYETALALYGRFRNNLLGVITDIEYPCAGHENPRAGLDLARIIKSTNPDMPVLLQSSNPAHAAEAAALNASFMSKNAPDISGQLRCFIRNYFGFGDFVFHSPDGREIARAEDLPAMIRQLRKVPLESIMFHSVRNHFSKWLLARTEFEIAYRIRPQQTSEFDNSPEKIRDYLIETLYRFMYETRQGNILRFDRRYYEHTAPFVKIGNGSIGGKARGLAFVAFLLSRKLISGSWGNNNTVSIPNTVVIATDVFDFFMEQNSIDRKLASAHCDADVEKIFLESRLPEYLMKDLEVVVSKIDGPLAVRSSSLLEDSRTQPFAGVYKTFMLPNSSPDRRVRLSELEKAVKLVYASVFSEEAVSYRKFNPFIIDDEKMAVVIQKIVGRKRPSGYFYPAFAGVLQSYNYYPVPPLKADEPVANIGIGLGETIVGGRSSLRFSPAHPRNLHQIGTVKACFENSQKEIRVLDISLDGGPERTAEGNAVKGIETAEKDGLLEIAGSVYSEEDDRIYPGTEKNGPRLITFAPALKEEKIPLSSILNEISSAGRSAMGAHIEVEFAADWNPVTGRMYFYILQMRPMLSRAAGRRIQIENLPEDRILLKTSEALGNGIYENIRDIIFVPPEKFSPGSSLDIAAEINAFNSMLASEKRKYLLIGPGRWGTSDLTLGIPVKWDALSSAAVITEISSDEIHAEPSCGSHFFHNVTSLGLGYLTVDTTRSGMFFRERLERCFVRASGPHVLHYRFEQPLNILIDGAGGGAAVLLPAACKNNNSVIPEQNMELNGRTRA